MKYRFTTLARRQLDEIVYYIALDNASAAERVYERILETCQMAADMPGIGRNTEYLTDPEILCVNVKHYHNYQLYYRKQHKEIIILWVIHGARDIPDLIGDK